MFCVDIKLATVLYTTHLVDFALLFKNVCNGNRVIKLDTVTDLAYHLSNKIICGFTITLALTHNLISQIVVLHIQNVKLIIKSLTFV